MEVHKSLFRFRYIQMKKVITQNIECAVETAAFTGIYSAILFAGAQILMLLV